MKCERTTGHKQHQDQVDREGGCRLQWSAVARIIARCLAVCAMQL
jgi:hypothetical protein